jgi:luciferase family oxidoreductase group 1
VTEQRPVPFSVLDLAPVVEGSTPAEALRNSLDLARHAEAWGYHRYWVAEHHNMPGIASSATAVLIGYLAGGTSRIRVGAGGVMLPNHSPLVVAEQFGTLESLYPGRIDLGLGRAPGTDPPTARALRRERLMAAEMFPQDVLELQSYFRPAAPGQPVRAVPGEGLNVPIWLLGSSDFSARFAASLGVPFAFASHFAPAYIYAALELYRSGFQPSEALQKPYVMIGVNVVAAETDREAARLFTSLQQQFIALRRGTPGKMPPPVDTMEGRWTDAEKLGVQQALSFSAVGTPETVKRGIERILAETGADELMVTTPVYDHAARLRSYELLAEVRDSLWPAARNAA